MFSSIAGKLRQDVLLELEENILPYWLKKMQDPRGGFFGHRDGYDILHPEAQKGAVMNARILWSFSAAYRLLGKPEYLDAATRAKREIIDRFYDKEFGGIFWSVDHEGKPLDMKKQFYALGFAIYGLSEYARALGDEEALEYAVKLFHDIESHSRDREKGGYVEALNRDWSPIADMRLSDKDLNATKSMNTHLHIIEPYTNLLRIWNSEELKEATVSLLHLFLDKIVMTDRRGHLALFFDDDWNELNPGIISYGHDIEASWLLLETAEVLGNKDIFEKTCGVVAKIADASLEGRCADGSMIYESFPDGRVDADRHWWVQAESVIGQLYMYLFHGRGDMLHDVYESWKYIQDHLIDRDCGEWFWSIRDGKPIRSEDKAGFWKCPYHNSRMCMEIIQRLG